MSGELSFSTIKKQLKKQPVVARAQLKELCETHETISYHPTLTQFKKVLSWEEIKSTLEEHGFVPVPMQDAWSKEKSEYIGFWGGPRNGEEVLIKGLDNIIYVPKNHQFVLDSSYSNEVYVGPFHIDSDYHIYRQRAFKVELPTGMEEVPNEEYGTVDYEVFYNVYEGELLIRDEDMDAALAIMRLFEWWFSVFGLKG